MSDLIIDLLHRIAQLEAQVKESEKDKERLDWLLENHEIVGELKVGRCWIDYRVSVESE